MDETTWYWPLIAGALGSALLLLTALLALIGLIWHTAQRVAQDEHE
jgi:hypothetical protein